MLLTKWWLRFKHLMYKVIKLRRNIDGYILPVYFFLSSRCSADPNVIIHVIVSLEIPAHAPSEGKHKQLTKQCGQLRGVTLKVV